MRSGQISLLGIMYGLCCVSDINECMLNPNICENGACENRQMGYRCVCNPGYQPDGTGTLCLGEHLSNSYLCVCVPVSVSIKVRGDGGMVVI